VKQQETASVAVQQRLEAIQKIETQQENAHFEADWDVLDAANEKLELTESQELQITKLSDNDLHKQTVAARNEFFSACAKAHSFAANRLIPLCEEIIKRYAMPGVAAKDRPNKQPTVDAYFRSIGLNYNTVRSWFYRGRDRKKLNDALFRESGYRAPEMRIEGDGTAYARSRSDLVKIKNLAEKIVLIGDGHNIDLRSVATDLLLCAGRRFANVYEAPELDPAAALAAVCER
jgi:hypothetical protein